MRIGFVTCVRLGLACVEEIYRIGGRLELLVSLQDDVAPAKSGRITLDAVAEDHGVQLLKVRNINDPDALAAVKAAKLDWLFIVGWSQIAHQELLSLPRNGVLGMHPTLLPEGRGRASVPWAILKDLPMTGVTMFKLDEGTDTGPIVGQEEVRLCPRETATTLYSKVVGAHLHLMNRMWPSLVLDEVHLAPQDDSLASNWEGRSPDDGRIDPMGMTVTQVDRLVRAATKPYPGAFVDLPHGLRLRIWQGSPGDQPHIAAGTTLTVSDGKYIMTDFEVEHQS